MQIDDAIERLWDIAYNNSEIKVYNCSKSELTLKYYTHASIRESISPHGSTAACCVIQVALQPPHLATVALRAPKLIIKFGRAHSISKTIKPSVTASCSAYLARLEHLNNSVKCVSALI